MSTSGRERYRGASSWVRPPPPVVWRSPIPGTVFPGAPFHIKLPGAGAEPSAITDFNGFVAIADIEGTGNGAGSGLTFGADMRFMTGTFKGTDNRIHRGTFGFI